MAELGNGWDERPPRELHPLQRRLRSRVGCDLGSRRRSRQEKFRTLLPVFGGWWMGWTSATIARYVYPPTQSAPPLGRVGVGSDHSACSTPHGIDLGLAGAGQALTVLVPGGPVRTVGTYSSSWVRPSKVRLLIMSRATSG